MRNVRITAALAMFTSLAASAAARAETPTLIESADGKRLLQISGNQVSTPDGKVLLTINKNDLLLDPTAPATLVVDDHDVRPSAAGVVFARFDGSDVRHGDKVDGKVVMNYRHPDLCPDAHANRQYVVNGPELTKQQLAAVLYELQPDLLKLSDEETAGQKKAMAAAAAESDKEAAADHVAGKWTVLNGHGPVEKINRGSITFAPGKAGVYPATFDYTADGGQTFTGVAFAKDDHGDRLIWAAFGTPKTIGLCVYKIDGGKLTGTWHPWYEQGDPKNQGTEELKGPETLDGDYEITSAKAPTTGAAYTGTVTIKPLEVVGADDKEKPYSVTWTIGGAKVQGVGIRTGDYLYVASGSGADTCIGKLQVQNGSFNGDFFKLGSTEMGGLAATN